VESDNSDNSDNSENNENNDNNENNENNENNKNDKNNEEEKFYDISKDFSVLANHAHILLDKINLEFIRGTFNEEIVKEYMLMFVIHSELLDDILKVYMDK